MQHVHMMIEDLLNALKPFSAASSDGFSVADKAHATETYNRISALTRASLPADAGVGEGEGKARAALAYLIDQIEYSDSYGVQGSGFMACHLCSGGGAPGVHLVHDADCPVTHVERVAAEWWDERQEERALSPPPVRESVREETIVKAITTLVKGNQIAYLNEWHIKAIACAILALTRQEGS